MSQRERVRKCVRRQNRPTEIQLTLLHAKKRAPRQVRLQVQQGAKLNGGDLYYTSMLHGLRRVSREEGVFWLWRPGVEVYACARA